MSTREDLITRAAGMQEDGLATSIFAYLWTRNEGVGFTCGIPDTLVYRARVLDAWYFTSLAGTDKGVVKKRGGAYLTHEAVLEYFKQREEVGVPVAVLLEHEEGGGGKVDPSGRVSCEYLSLDGLHTFLVSRRKPLSGVLQRFVLPKGGHNSVLRAVWSPNPQLCRTDRRTTRASLYDATKPLLDRVVTYDGPPHLSSEEPVHGDALPRSIASLCDTIVAHVHAVTHGAATISRMVLLLKVGADGKLVLLYATSVRLDQSSALHKAGAVAAAMASRLVQPLSSLTPPGVAGSPAHAVDAQASVATFLSSTSRATTVGRLTAALRSPTGVVASSSKGSVDLATSPVAKATKTGRHEGLSAHKHDKLDLLAEEAETTDKAKPGAGYLARKADLYAPPDAHDHAIPPVAVGAQCPSCGRRRVPGGADLLVPHVTIVRHYEALCRLLSVDPFVDSGMGAMMRGGGLDLPAMQAVAPKACNFWPSVGATLALSTGIGVYGAFPAGSIETGAEEGGMGVARTTLAVKQEPVDGTGRPRRLLVTEVPPTLLAVHPALRASAYRGLRRDPLWLSKTVPVCDLCYTGFTSIQEARMEGRSLEAALLHTSGMAGVLEQNRRRAGGGGGGAPSVPPLPRGPGRGLRVGEHGGQPDGGGYEEVGGDTPWSSTPHSVTPLLSGSRVGTAEGGAQRGGGGGSEGGAAAPVRTAVGLLAGGAASPQPRAAALLNLSPDARDDAVRRLDGIIAGAQQGGGSPAGNLLSGPPPVLFPSKPAFLLQADDPVYSVKADAWDVHGFSQPSPSSGLLSAGLVTYGRRQYLGVVRRAQAWETVGIVWRDGEGQGEREAGTAGAPGTEPAEDSVADGDDAETVTHRSGPVPDSEQFCVYMRSAKSGRTMAMFIRGRDLSVSRNKVVRKALAAVRAEGGSLCAEGRVRAEGGGGTLHSDAEGGTPPPLPLSSSGTPSVVMQGLYAHVPSAVDYCVLTCAPRPDSEATVRGDLLFRLVSCRVGGSDVRVVGPSPFYELYEAMVRGGVAHPGLVYAAKARLLASMARAEEAAGARLLLLPPGQSQHAGAGGALHLLAYASHPVPGAVLRLAPGHFLGGNASLDRYRGWGAAEIAAPSHSSAAAGLLRGATSQTAVTKLDKRQRRKAGATGSDDRAAHPGTVPPHPSSTLSVTAVAGTLEAIMDLPAVQGLEREFTAAQPSLGVGTLARALVVCPSGTTLLVALALAVPGGGAGAGDPGSTTAADKAHELLYGRADAGLHLRVFNLSDGKLKWSTYVGAAELRTVLTDRAQTALLEEDNLETNAQCPGNPLLQASASLALTDVPWAAAELVLATRTVPASFCQRFVGVQDAGSTWAARHAPFGPHPSVKTDGHYVLSLSLLRNTTQDAVVLAGHVLPGCVDTTTTRAEGVVRASRAAHAGPGEGPAVVKPGAAVFLVRCQYTRHPLPLYEPTDSHDGSVVRVAAASSRVIKTSYMMHAEVEHWVRHGQLPTPQALVAMAQDRDKATVLAAAGHVHRVRACQTACDPVFTYTLGLEQMRRADLNPFLDVLGGLGGVADV